MGDIPKTGIIQPAVIDVADWVADELHFNYPEGAREKRAYFRPDHLELNFIKKKRRYLFKRSDKRYPDQFWGEVVSYHVGCLLNLEVPPAYAAINSKEGDCAALIEWFYEDGKAEFDAGGVYMQRLIPEYDRKRGLQHNFDTVLRVGRTFHAAGWLDESWVNKWSEVFLFDALIGNTDRHQDNWGCLYTLVEKKFKAKFSPLFDNGTSLAHERWPHLLEKWDDKRFHKYINEGCHHIRWSITDQNPVGHISGISELVKRYPEQADIFRKKISEFSIELLTKTLEHLSTLNLPIVLTPERKDLYIKFITLRKRNIELALQ